MKQKQPRVRYHTPQRRASSRFTLRGVLRMAFVPGEHNQYRPQLVRSWVLLLLVVSFVGGQLSVSWLQHGQVLADMDYISPTALLDDTNAFRQDAGVKPLRINPKLTDAATAKVRDMFVHQYWNHVSPSGVQPWFWVTQSDYVYRAAGENLAKNFHTAAATIQAWYDSPVHRDNMLSSHYSEVGFATASGVLNGERATITVAMYGEPVYTGVVLATAPKAQYPAGPAHFTSAGIEGSLSMVDRIGLALQAMPPLVIGVLGLLIIMTFVLVAAHRTRSQLPPSHVRHQLRHHHALIKGVGVFVFIVSIFWLYGGGQI